jgi:hypothetical protein
MLPAWDEVSGKGPEVPVKVGPGIARELERRGHEIRQT